jgi:hypothetical protein
MIPREVLERMICRENGTPYGTPMDDNENINISFVLADLAEIVRGEKKYCSCTELDPPCSCFEKYNQAITDIAKLFEATNENKS